VSKVIEQVHDVLHRVSVNSRGIGNQRSKALDILGDNCGRSVELGQVRTEVEAVEEQDCTSYGLRKEIVFDHNYRLFVRKSRTICTMMRVKMMTLAVPKIV